MNTYYFNDVNYKKTEDYKRFLEQNPTVGFLRIRVSAASEAIPVKGLKIIVSTIINNNKIIFFEGFTDESGLIDKIILPAPELSSNNQDIPAKTSYTIDAIANTNNIINSFQIYIYESVLVVQNIKVSPIGMEAL